MIMGHLYYFFGLVVFLTNLSFLMEFFNYLKIKEWHKSFEKVTKKIPNDKDFKKGDLEKFKKFNGVIGINFLWIFFGIMSESWKIFLLILSFNLIINLLTHIIGEFKMFSKIINFIKIIVISATILILCLNHFHLHLDLFKLLGDFLSR
jgi:hypothetical protein